MPKVCQCCKKEVEKLFVYSSILGGVSIATCKECLMRNCEPSWIIEAQYATLGDDFSPRVDGITTFHNGKYISFRDYIELLKKDPKVEL